MASYDLNEMMFLESRMLAKLSVSRSLGVLTRKEHFCHSGMHSAVWDGKNDLGQMTSSGVYIYRLQVGSFTQTRKMIFLE